MKRARARIHTPSRRFCDTRAAPASGHRVARTARHVGVALALLLGGCGDGFTNADYVGVWQVEVPAAPGCWAAVVLFFEVEPEDAAVSEGAGVLNMVSDWWLPGDPADRRSFSGHFSEDDFAFVFGPSTSLRMEGPPGTSQSVTGTFRDRDGVTFPAGCRAPATATHR